MSKSRSLKLWRQDSKEPDWYNKMTDPLHKTDQHSGCLDFHSLAQNLTSAMEKYLDTKNSTEYNRAYAILKQNWGNKEGDGEQFEQAQQIAYKNSKFWKRMLK